MFDTLFRATKVATNIVTLPVSATADLVTFGGDLTDRRESHTESKATRIGKDAKRLLDDIAG